MAVAVFAAFITLAPYWRAQSQTPPGWTFTGNVSASPDKMQYRAWMRQTQETGLLVADRFTTEPNEPHLPVIFYFVIGRISSWTGVQPEFVYAYAGSVLAFALAIVLFVIIRQFLDARHQVWWVFLATLFGGGLGAHLKLLSSFEMARNNFILNKTLVEGLQARPVLEDYRWPYPIVSIFDPHSLLLWLLVTSAVTSLYFTLKKFSPARLGLTALLFATATVVHIYQGIVLLTITAAVILVFWRKGLPVRAGLMTLGLSAVAVTACMVWQMLLYRSSGLILPTWRARSILFSTVLIGFPLAWGLIAWGISRFWRQAGFKGCFLLGWALGCTALTLSGPFFPYPDRGLLTLQVPLLIIAGSIYFGRFRRLTPIAALVGILVLGLTPAWVAYRQWEHTDFNAEKPYMFMSDEHRDIVNALRQMASENDVLIVDKSAEPWETDDLWLAPEYPGKLYCGHFFLTVNYEQKCSEIVRFYHESTPEEQVAFLKEKDIRFVYVDAENTPRAFDRVPGLVLVKSAPFGSLFEFKSKASNVDP